MGENKECLFYISHNPPKYSGTWGGAIHKGACKINSIDCCNNPDCFIKSLYQRVKDLEDENKKLLLLVNKKGLN